MNSFEPYFLNNIHDKLYGKTNHSFFKKVKNKMFLLGDLHKPDHIRYLMRDYLRIKQ